MKHEEPKNASSWIKAIGFENGTIEILCHSGKIMRYHGDGPDLPLTKDDYDRFLESDSPGKFYNTHIKKVYPGETIEPDPPAQA